MSAARGSDERLGAVLDFPWEVLEYLSWLRRSPQTGEGTGNYLFDQPQLRFEPRDEDIIVCEPGLAVRSEQGRLCLSSPRAANGVELAGLSSRDRDETLQVLSAFDSERCLAEVRLAVPQPSRALASLLQHAFGRALFAPLAVSGAERAISGVEITRFPGSPYEIARPYWQNMAAVRAALPRLESALDDDQRFARQLCELHVIALMGENLDSYYQPQSPISGRRAAPGRLMLTATRVVERSLAVAANAPAAHFVVSGPIVHAAQLGGERYHELLRQSLGAPRADAVGAFSDETGLDFGRIVRATTPSDPLPKPWFCPPRPLVDGHFESLRRDLRRALGAAEHGNKEACLHALAAFHQNFIRVHPFHCGNQSLAMNIVNRVLLELAGAGIPHLMLDHLALRHSAEAYAVAFRRCVAVYVDPQTNPALRYLELSSRRTRTFELAKLISEASSDDAARELVQADRATARSLLLCD